MTNGIYCHIRPMGSIQDSYFFLSLNSLQHSLSHSFLVFFYLLFSAPRFLSLFLSHSLYFHFSITQPLKSFFLTLLTSQASFLISVFSLNNSFLSLSIYLSFFLSFFYFLLSFSFPLLFLFFSFFFHCHLSFLLSFFLYFLTKAKDPCLP